MFDKQFDFGADGEFEPPIYYETQEEQYAEFERIQNMRLNELQKFSD